MKPKKTFSVYVLLIGVMGLSIVGGILAFQIFSATTKTQLTPEQAAAIKPIDGKINQTVINNLEKRTQVSEDEISRIQMTQIITTLAPTPASASASAEATVSAQPTPIQ